MDSKPSGWRERVWRRPLTAVECDALGSEPDLEMEARLTEGLNKIPDSPVASNFTARVMAAVEREEARRTAPWYFHWNWRGLFPRMAALAAILIFTGTIWEPIWERYEVRSQHIILARNIAEVTYFKQVPSLDAIYNFDAIQRMSQPVAADKELLALLQ